ncbi:DUF1015 domain-containing protein [Nocardiopsis gilva YIM 90087]|uniref:DUF1015 domain-containing protein n=1 Tax=Nocardiopsis gilva YIM 90087 TaxID=1235441 RepID=A0A223S903_9ACTN|nr:DUF1015 domain-containing protein [Nocardiopsis gilva YIM 90087]
MRGLRYATRDAGALIDSPAFNLALALAPPYDVVDAESFLDMMRAEPHNAMRLTAPPAGVNAESVAGLIPSTQELTGPDRYHAAARTLRAWIGNGILVRDSAPVIYVYEQTSPTGERQRGLIGALRLPPPSGRAVRPHEDTAPGPVADRVQLMATTRANLEPIFLLYRGGTGGARGAATVATDVTADSGTAPLVDTVTGDGIAHRLWAIDDPAVHADIATDLATRTALIADGHHRYAAYQQLRAERPSPGPWEHGLAMLVDSDASPPRLGAIHRVLRDIDVHTAARSASKVAEVERLSDPVNGAGEMSAAMKRLRLEAADGPALLLVGPGDDAGYLLHNFTTERLAAVAPDRSAEWRMLPTAALEHLLCPLWEVDNGRIDLIHDDPAEAVDTTRPGLDTAVLVPSLRVEDVYAVTARGELTPRKSTSFGPKPRTGLVMRHLE